MHETGWPFAMLVLWELGIGGEEAGRRFKAEVGELLRWLMRENMMMTVVAGTRLCYFLRPVSSAVRDILRWRPPM